VTYHQFSLGILCSLPTQWRWWEVRFFSLAGNSLQNNPLQMCSFHFYRWNQFKLIPLAYMLRTRNVRIPKFFEHVGCGNYRHIRSHQMAPWASVDICVCEQLPGTNSSPTVTKLGQSYPWPQGTRCLHSEKSRSQVKVGGGGMRSTERPSSTEYFLTMCIQAMCDIRHTHLLITFVGNGERPISPDSNVLSVETHRQLRHLTKQKQYDTIPLNHISHLPPE